MATPKLKKRYPIILMTVIIFFSLLIPLAYPLGLPIAVTEMTKEFFTYIDNLPDGSLILHDCEPWAGSVRGTTDTLKYIMKKDLKWIGYSTSARGAGFMMDALKVAGAFDSTTWVYGEDWVYFGYLPGLEAVHIAMRDNFPSITQTDYKGTPAADLPLLDGITGIENFDLVLGSGETTQTLAYIFSSYKTTLSIVPTDFFPVAYPYYPQSIKALLNGNQAAAELETLTGMPGSAIASSDALSMAMIVTLGVVFIAQFETLVGKKKGVELRVEEGK